MNAPEVGHLPNVKAHLESALEEHIETHLLGHGWHQGDPSAYSRALGLDTVELLTFLGASQPEKWAKLVALHGSPDVAQGKFERRLADELTSRGVIDVLRRGVKDLEDETAQEDFRTALRDFVRHTASWPRSCRSRTPGSKRSTTTASSCSCGCHALTGAASLTSTAP